jgi:CheY-like chemotaxis protein/anti-sigma regulatory factor (Ser/Thr protein kinase)
VVGDRPQLQQVVLNLIHNAIDAVSAVKNAAPTVRVTLSAVDGDAVLVVSDNGPGIEPAVQRRMFEPFFSTKRAGRGLGLATVFGLTQAHGGSVVIDSVVGTGANFTVRLPRTNAKPQPMARASGRFAPVSSIPVDAEPVAAPVVGPMTLLLIDDDDRVRRATRRLLERLGHAVIDVDGGEAGLAVTEAYDLAVVDVTMPGMDGPTSLARLRERRPGLPAVLVTGRGDLADDGDIVLTKPFDADGLKAALATAIMRRRSV